jgi:hypothetical protein
MTLLVAVAVTALSGLALAAVVTHEPSGQTPHESLADSLRADAPPERLLTAKDASAFEGKFSVLAKPASANSSMGEAAAYTSMTDTARAVAIRPGHDAPEQAARWQAFVAPSHDATEICVLSLPPDAVGAGGSCDTLDRAAKGTLLATMGNIDDGFTQVLGVMPDGVDSVVLAYENGERQTLPVVDNSYRADVTLATRSVTFTLPGDSRPTTIEARSYSG